MKNSMEEVEVFTQDYIEKVDFIVKVFEKFKRSPCVLCNKKTKFKDLFKSKSNIKKYNIGCVKCKFYINIFIGTDGWFDFNFCQSEKFIVGINDKSKYFYIETAKENGWIKIEDNLYREFSIEEYDLALEYLKKLIKLNVFR